MRNNLERKNKKLVINIKHALASRDEHDLGSPEDSQRRESARENQEWVSAELQRNMVSKSDDACRLPRKQQVKCVDEDEVLNEQTSVCREVRDDMIRELDIGIGLSGALDLLRKQGTFKEMEDECNSWNMVERKRKRKDLGVEDEKFRDGFKDIQIERVDEWGKKLTAKEAFRSLSYGFHGKGPGKKKQEKRRKQEAKLKQVQTSERDLETVERIRVAHARLKSPYIVL